MTDEKPESDVYVKSDSRSWFSLPISRYYMDEKFAPKAETLLVISGLFIDDVAIEDIIKNE